MSLFLPIMSSFLSSCLLSPGPHVVYCSIFQSSCGFLTLLYLCLASSYVRTGTDPAQSLFWIPMLPTYLVLSIFYLCFGCLLCTEFNFESSETSQLFFGHSKAGISVSRRKMNLNNFRWAFTDPIHLGFLTN